ncbi:expressed unknown protein [Seminavis robusta]|uniref:Uncharacterized protein n=1 Tax=Seminavis robusta TaxID=568900 RepID=A0A9N8H6Z1_9STRA|nr:expressed unknown protein [Seminavis robusta]|eukprot:Sro56_g032840.1 n/a (358) ;mRNA; f:83148-84221
MTLALRNLPSLKLDVGASMSQLSAGMALRNNPMDQLQDHKQGIPLHQEILLPMEKVYCDRRVRGLAGQHFYRVQGRPYASWVFDKRIRSDKTVVIMMQPESQIRVGLFAFETIRKIAIRSKPDVGDDTKTSWSVKEGEIIVCDIVRESPHPYGNGPFLRLTDGSGWLFVNKYGDAMMREVQVEQGEWTCKVRNLGSSVLLRKQPTYRKGKAFEDSFQPNHVFQCDRRVPASRISSASFFRVKGTRGWIFDYNKDGTKILDLLSGGPSIKVCENLPTDPAWSVLDVRILAAAIPAIHEIDHNFHSRVISFSDPDGGRTNVYYTTRTVGTALNHPNQGKTQLFRRNCTKEDLAETFEKP